MNNNNNSNNELLFWKVFRNKYIRNYILSKIINNNNKHSHHSYNGTTSLSFLFYNNQLKIILDKLKSNHHINIDDSSFYTRSHDKIKFHNIFDTPKDYSYDKIKFHPVDPQYKSILNEIDQLLCSKYSSMILKKYSFPNNSYDNNRNLKLYQLWFPNDNKYNYYMAHKILYKKLNYHSEIKLIKYLNQLINNKNYNKEYNHIIKKQKINNITIKNNNNNNQYFIQQLKSSTLSSSSLAQNEIIEAIYNNQSIPIHINHYFSNLDTIYGNLFDQELFENEFNGDIKTVLLNLHRDTRIFYFSNNKEILELIVLKLLHHHHIIIELGFYSIYLGDYYPVDSIIHAKVYCLNQINRKYRELKEEEEEVRSSILKFKQHLINNQINTLEELILAAKDIFGEIINYIDSFGHYYYYYNLLNNYNLPILNYNGCSELLSHYSVLTQKVIKNLVFTRKIYFLSIRNSVGNGFGNSSSDDQLIKDKSTSYFNQLIDQTNIISVWFELFKFVIGCYNSKLFEWLLDSNKQLKDIYKSILYNQSLSFNELFLAHTRMDIESDHVDYDMLDVLIKYIKEFKLEESKYQLEPKYQLILMYGTDKRIGSDHNIGNSTKRKAYIINHLIKSLSNCNCSFINFLIFDLMVNGFKELEFVDEIINIYNLIDQDLLLNYYKSIILNNIQSSKFNISYINNKSIILVHTLITSIINLDFESINKVISATLNNNNNNNNNNNINNNNNYNYNSNFNIYIPTTFNNSLDIIKYLISKQFLKEFNLEYLLKQIILNIQVDREFIIEIIELSNNNENNKTIIEVLDVQINQMNKILENKLEGRIKRYEIISKNLERFKDQQINNPIDSKTTKDIQLQLPDGWEYYEDSINIEFNEFTSNYYYNQLYQFLTNNKNITNGIVLNHLYNNSISTEWFSKFYPLILKNLFTSNNAIIEQCYQNPPEIFEFVWNNHFDNNQQRKEFILGLLDYHRPDDVDCDQLIEYILVSKKEFILSIELNQDQIFRIHKNVLFYSYTQLFHQVRIVFQSFNFKINYGILWNLIRKKNGSSIIYLHEHNLIPNLKQIIGTDNLSIFKIKEYHNWEHKYNLSNSQDNNNIIVISKSMFILIHTIIKLQQQQQ